MGSNPFRVTSLAKVYLYILRKHSCKNVRISWRDLQEEYEKIDADMTSESISDIIFIRSYKGPIALKMRVYCKDSLRITDKELIDIFISSAS